MGGFFPRQPIAEPAGAYSTVNATNSPVCVSGTYTTFPSAQRSAAPGASVVIVVTLSPA